MAKKSKKRFQAENWSTEAFLSHFMRVHDQMPERGFAFVLGAGASKSCGIVTGGELVDKWLEELKERDPDRKDIPIKKWATSDRLDIDDFTYDRRAEFYPQIYDRRFRDDLEEGYAYLEDVMKDADPGLGYSMLAQILTDSRHKVVITTNFDNLVADAVLLYTDTFAQVCGHESLTAFVRTEPRRPLVAKIHRDLLLGPQNDPTETALLHEDWQRTLRKIFTRYTPIFVGYGGNDGSLMNFLSSLKRGAIPGTMFWCYREADGEPNERIQRLLVRHSGKIVPILDFDTFMCQIAEPLEYGLLDRQVEGRGKKRAEELREQWSKVKDSTEKATGIAMKDKRALNVSTLARDAMDKVETRRVDKEGDWWSWELKAMRESDPQKREQVYRAGIHLLPRSAEMHRAWARFIYKACKNYDKAEQLLRKAIDLDPEYGAAIGDLAVLLNVIRRNYDEAERQYLRSIELLPESAVAIGNYGLFLYQVRNDKDEAERLFRKAMELDPERARGFTNYAFFLHEARGDYIKPNDLYRRAMKLDPADAVTPALFTRYLIERGELKEAIEMSDRAWSLCIGGATREAAESAMFRGLLLHCGNKDDAPALGRLQVVFDRGFLRAPRQYASLFSAVDQRLSEEDRMLYHTIADAILEEEKVAALDEFPRWKKVDPIPLDEPWPPLAEQD